MAAKSISSFSILNSTDNNVKMLVTYGGQTYLLKLGDIKNLITKENIGLGNVDNTPDAHKQVASAAKFTSPVTINGVAFDGSSNITITATDSIARIPETDKGAPNGVATLDHDGKVPATQLPSYVDDVLEFDTLTDFPNPGEKGKIYVAKDTNRSYRWSGSNYIIMPSSDVTSVAGRTGVVVLTRADVGLANVDNTSDMDKVVGQAVKLRNAQDITIGNTTKSFDGSTAVSWTLAEMGVSVAGHTHTKADVGLDQVDNTSDLDKPLSNAIIAALSGKSPIGHSHVVGDVIGLEAEINDIVNQLAIEGVNVSILEW